MCVRVHIWEHVHFVIHNVGENDELAEEKGIKMLLGEKVVRDESKDHCRCGLESHPGK